MQSCLTNPLAFDLLGLGPMQFCLFLKALIGPEEMRRVMAKQIPPGPPDTTFTVR
jgi:hypothetical protein